jgi:hypothetical protein
VTLSEDLEWFRKAIADAAASVDTQFFQLPVAGQGNPVNRERVYCYELYHQLRSKWPVNCRYSLGGEVDKTGHPLIRGGALDRAKPDLIVHVPGDMESNLAVVEVKGGIPLGNAIALDFHKLLEFRLRAGYAAAIYLVYGIDKAHVAALRARCKKVADHKNIDLSMLELLVHSAIGERPRTYAW